MVGSRARRFKFQCARQLAVVTLYSARSHIPLRYMAKPEKEQEFPHLFPAHKHRR